MRRVRLFIFAAALGLAAILAFAQLPSEPAHDTGQSITGAFEGWFPNADGTFSILVGYYNRNQKQHLEIAPGPENKIEPGGPDRGQPTHFLPGRQWGVFTIRVPKDFGDARLTWTLTANGQTTAIPLHLNTLWELQPFRDATGNTPPYIGFSESGPFANGPSGPSAELTARTGQPLPLTVWLADDAKSTIAVGQPRTPPVTVSFSKFRGPGEVTFSDERPPVQKAEFRAPAPFTVKASTTATFGAAGAYILRVQANDWTGEGGRGFQCCWSSAQVKVTVQ